MGLFFAWAIGEGILFWRWGSKGAPPTPGVLVESSTLFLALAVVSAYQPARMFATAAAFGLDLAILLQVVGTSPQVATGWPPAPITDAGVTFPTGGPQTAQAGSGGSGSSSGSGSGGRKWNFWTGYL